MHTFVLLPYASVCLCLYVQLQRKHYFFKKNLHHYVWYKIYCATLFINCIALLCSYRKCLLLLHLDNAHMLKEGLSDLQNYLMTCSFTFYHVDEKMLKPSLLICGEIWQGEVTLPPPCDPEFNLQYTPTHTHTIPVERGMIERKQTSHHAVS